MMGTRLSLTVEQKKKGKTLSTRDLNCLKAQTTTVAEEQETLHQSYEQNQDPGC